MGDFVSVPLRRSLVVGITFFALVMSLGQALAGDSGSSNDNGTITGVVNANAPTINVADIRNTGNTTVTGTQLDVLSNYRFYLDVTESNGWASLRNVYVQLWFDLGTDTTTFATATAANNYRINVTYDNSAAQSSPTAGQWSVKAGNVALGAVVMNEIVASQEYAFQITFQLDAQIHQAQLPSAARNGGYSNAYSWNGQFTARDANGNLVTRQSDATSGDYYEFGVFQHTSVTLGGQNWAAGGVAPGASSQTGTVTVTHTSNANYKLFVYANGNLVSGSNTIAIGNVLALAAADLSDDLSSNTAFPGTGSVNPIYLMGSGATFHAFAPNTNSTATVVQFQINVPLGTPVGTYTATLVMTVQQQAPPTP